MAGKAPAKKKPVRKSPKFKGKPTLRQIVNAAAKEGMSYGKFIAKYKL